MTTKQQAMTVTKETLGEPVEADFLPATVDDATPVNGGGALAAFNTDDPWAAVSDGDLMPPGANRIQFLELNRKIDGGFIDSETGEKTNRVVAVWLARSMSRAWWSEPFSGKDAGAPECRSFDGITSDPSSPKRQTEKCATCPKSRWDGDKPPACRAAIEAMVYLPEGMEDGRLARIRFGGIAFAPAAAYWESFANRFPKRPPMAFVTEITLHPEKTDNGDFLKPRFARVAELPYDEATGLIAERDRRIGEWKADIAAAVVAQRPEDEAAKAEQHPGSEPGTYVTGADEEPF